ncbi:Cytospin-A [Dissostichus eleginoides]|uniref:Cytospin-A n=1 Tax=Dissostichus eleginoides TaxID=100907 RepID=A0AAD9FJG0_DISEL|nr:Cytospin-A [Dissostichus eleginoides]
MMLYFDATKRAVSVLLQGTGIVPAAAVAVQPLPPEKGLSFVQVGQGQPFKYNIPEVPGPSGVGLPPPDEEQPGPSSGSSGSGSGSGSGSSSSCSCSCSGSCSGSSSSFI